jgi:hypothetical protein
MTDTATLQARLAEAEEARHQLAIGKQGVTLDVGDLGSKTYARTDLDKLDAYIAALKSELSTATGVPQDRRRPIHLSF